MGVADRREVCVLFCLTESEMVCRVLEGVEYGLGVDFEGFERLRVL